jgi:hypothetical protein
MRTRCSGSTISLWPRSYLYAACGSREACVAGNQHNQNFYHASNEAFSLTTWNQQTHGARFTRTGSRESWLLSGMHGGVDEPQYAPFLKIAPMQHDREPPGRAPQAEPPHLPHRFGQQAAGDLIPWSSMTPRMPAAPQAAALPDLALCVCVERSPLCDDVWPVINVASSKRSLLLLPAAPSELCGTSCSVSAHSRSTRRSKNL